MKWLSSILVLAAAVVLWVAFEGVRQPSPAGLKPEGGEPSTDRTRPELDPRLETDSSPRHSVESDEPEVHASDQNTEGPDPVPFTVTVRGTTRPSQKSLEAAFGIIFAWGLDTLEDIPMDRVCRGKRWDDFDRSQIRSIAHRHQVEAEEAWEAAKALVIESHRRYAMAGEFARAPIGEDEPPVPTREGSLYAQDTYLRDGDEVVLVAYRSADHPEAAEALAEVQRLGNEMKREVAEYVANMPDER